MFAPRTFSLHRQQVLKNVTHVMNRAYFSNTVNLRNLKPAAPQDTVQKSEASKQEAQTHFGFKDVPVTEKETLVGKVFSNVASKYDIMNDAMSAGIHRVWKAHFIEQLAPEPGTKLLDVAGGTGDIALRFLDHCRDTYKDRTAHVTVLDINPEMLKYGRQRFAATKYYNTPQVNFVEGNAENLADIPDNTFDAYTIAFGIRNCTHVDRALKEAHRVLKPGGRFMCLEFSKVENPLLSKAYDMYSFEVIPRMGEAILNDRDSYQYLVESIRKFPDQETFAKMIKDAGFATFGKGYENLTFGIAAIHTGIKY
ncbi:2-hexaprenyl-6-methoxy-1,4-benzoquinone methyltransferase [Basidiobolus ranarum]|uniref:2-methoxy-6-polyprenyl-1,4-benzoquinol methylase, mitochondrial n=1 Tax=Basidiobolus ranarum TaxID=34480 RepID=A0ABR2WMS4_9FUNG